MVKELNTLITINNHRQSDKCHKSTERRLRQRYVEMAETCGEMESSMYGGGGRQESGECNNVPVSGKIPRPNRQRLSGCAAEHHARKICLRETRDTALKSGGRTKGIDNCLQGGGAGNSNVWVGYVGPFGDNGEEVGRYTHWVPLSDHGGLSEAYKIRDIGDAWGGRRT